MPEIQWGKSGPLSLRRAMEVDSGRTVLPTGSGIIDGLLEGGLKTGEMVEVFGASNSGKTQLGLQAAVSAAVMGHTCVYVDTEGQFRPERLSSICAARAIQPEGVLKSVYVIRAENTRRQAGAILAIRKESGPSASKLVVVDTLTKNFSLELGGSKLVGRRQTVLGAYLNRLARDAYFNDRAVLLLNRVASVGPGESREEVDIGGQTVRHFIQKAVHLTRRGEGIFASLQDALPPREVTTRIEAAGLA